MEQRTIAMTLSGRYKKKSRTPNLVWGGNEGTKHQLFSSAPLRLRGRGGARKYLDCNSPMHIRSMTVSEHDFLRVIDAIYNSVLLDKNEKEQNCLANLGVRYMLKIDHLKHFLFQLLHGA